MTTWNDRIVDKAMTALAQSVAAIVAAPNCDKARAMATTFTQFQNYLKSNVVKALPPNDPEPDDEEEEEEEQEEQDDETGQLPPLVEQFVNALITANPNLDRQQAAHWLLHSPHGRAMITHLSKRKEPVMDRATELRKMAGEYGVARIAKMITMDNDAHGLTEHELIELAGEEFAKQALPGERPNTTFARLYNAPENLELRKAIQLTKSTLAQVVQKVEPTDTPVTAADSADAYQKLEKIAAELRTTSPQLSSHQAFAKAFEAHPDLAAKAHRRPQTGSYA